MMYGTCFNWRLSKAASLTCRLGGKFVPVGSTHSQQPVAQVQVKALLSSNTTHHLGTKQTALYKLCFYQHFKYFVEITS